MEKNIHDPDFDDYIRHSFDTYEELPGSGMWDRIVTELEPDDRKKRPVLWWWSTGYRWSLAASVALLVLAGGIWAMRRNDHQPVSVARKMPVQQESDKNNTTPTATLPSAISPIDHTSAAPDVLPAVHGTVSNKNKSEIRYPVPAPASTGAPQSISVEMTAHLSVSNAHYVDSQLIKTIAAADDSVRTRLPLATLTVHEPGLLANPVSDPEFDVFPTAERLAVVIPRRHFYIGFNTTPFRLQDHARYFPASPVQRRFASYTQRPEPAVELGIRVGGTFYRRWGWESGVGYRAVSRHAVHFPRFRFGDGVYRPGSAYRNYDFNYNLDTYGGTAEVTMRMEQVDNNTHVNQNEAVSLKVFTHETVQLLRIPLLVTARLGLGKWQATAKAGLVGNVILDNEVDITSRISTANRFRPGKTYTVSPDINDRFFLGYQVSAGVSWQFYPSWSVVLEPTFAGDFSRTTTERTQLPGLMSVGLSLGIQKQW